MKYAFLALSVLLFATGCFMTFKSDPETGETQFYVEPHPPQQPPN